MGSKSTSDASSEPRQPSDAREGEIVTYAITLKIERVVPRAVHQGAALVVQEEPQLVVLAFVTDSNPSGRFAPDVPQAFAVHDLESLGLNGWQPGSTAEFELTATRNGDETTWRLVALKPW